MSVKFFCGVMGGGKTEYMLSHKEKLNSCGLNVLLLKPKIDSRDGQKIIKSRSGRVCECEYVEDFIENWESRGPLFYQEYTCVFVDEAQFLTREQVEFFVLLETISVCLFGLKTDFQGNLFEGSKAAIEMATLAEPDEIVKQCWCGKKATHNARYNQNGIIRDGNIIEIGSDERYAAVCYKHFFAGDIGKF